MLTFSIWIVEQTDMVQFYVSFVPAEKKGIWTTYLELLAMYLHR